MLGLLALLVTLGQAPGANPSAASLELALGSDCKAMLTPEARASFTFRPKSALRFSVLVSSLDFPPTLLLCSPPGNELMRTHEPWIWSDARIVAEAAAGSVFELEVGTFDGLGGEFTISVRAGEESAPKGHDLFVSRVEILEDIVWRAVEKEDCQRAIRSCLSAGNISITASDPGAAHALLQIGVVLAQKTGAVPSALHARLLLAVGDGMEGKHKEALAQLQELQPDIESFVRAVDLEDQNALAWYMFVAVLQGGLADARKHIDGSAAALPHYRCAAAAAQLTDLLAQERGWDPLMAVEAWSKLTDALGELGQDAEADQVLANCEDVATDQGSDRRAQAQAQALVTRARLEGSRDEMLESRAHALEALAREDRAPEANPSLRGEILGALANACIDLSQYEEAVRYLDELETLCEDQQLVELEIPRHRARAVLGYKIADLSSAQEEIEAALARAEALEEKDGIIETRIDKGLILECQRKHELARQEYDEAMKLASARGNKRLQALTWICRADLQESAGESERAASAYGGALALGKELHDTRIVALAESALGRLARARGDLQSASTYSLSAVAGFEAIGRGEDALEPRETLALLALERKDAAALLFEIEAARVWTRRNPRKGLDPFRRSSHRSRLAPWARLEQSLVDLELAATHAAGAQEQSLFQKGLESASLWKGRVLLDELAHASKEPLPDTDLHYERRSSWLPEHAALLEYAESSERLLLYVVCQGGIRRLDLGPAEVLGKQAQDLAARMADELSDKSALMRASNKTWKAILAPALSGLPPSIRTLVVVPASSLAALPFDALVRDVEPGSGNFPGEPRCVIDDYTVCYLPASPMLGVLDGRPPRSDPRARTLIVGDAWYPAEDLPDPPPLIRGGLDTSLSTLKRLPKTRDESLDVAEEILGTRPEEASKWLVRLRAEKHTRTTVLETGCFDLYLGRAAEPAVLRRDLTGYSDIHLALHAVADPTDPGRTGLVLSSSGSESGLFTLSDVWRSRIDANLVCLAACETARGPILEGEGVESLAYYFLMAGARAVVATLWEIDDGDAADILGNFETFRHSTAGLHAAQALHDARQSFRKELQARGENAQKKFRWDPRRWAGCIYFGAPPK
jgi:CHAT domain-containing protein